MMPVEETDVLIVGCGPVGALTANLLGLNGVRTLVLERELTEHSQPRAITCDDEALRIYQSAGLGEVMDAHMRASSAAEFQGTEGEVFARIVLEGLDFGYGYPAVRFFSQPYVEKVLRQGMQRFPHVELRLGQRVESFVQDTGSISALVQDVRDGSTRTVRARYLLACDGARSAMRQHAGIDMVGSTYQEMWLTVTLALPEPLRAPTRFICDPERPVMISPTVGNEVRYECMLKRGERPEEVASPANVRRLLSPYVDMDRATVVRAACYVFNRRVAGRWRSGRMFLLGDAAHLMPPFMGQGLVSGLRDAANLAWKLACVVHGQAGDSLLDTYEQERRPHAEAMLQVSVNVGHVFLTRRPQVARVRDVFFRALDHIPRAHRFIRNFEFKPQPLIPKGFLVGGARSHRQAPEGEYFPQPRVALPNGGEVRLDEALGPGFSVVVHPDIKDASRRAAEALAESVGARCVGFLPAGSGPALPGEVVDVEGKLSAWFRQHQVEVAVVRPDRYVFGAVRGSHLSWLSSALRAWLIGAPPVRAQVPPLAPVLRPSGS
jgi:3-(3-hydroxy-phenyl)propionate hydroxylase